ncbi:MAG: SAVED domain-containing protein [Methylococcaceae bacterium]
MIDIWSNIDKASQVLGIIAFFPILYSAYVLFYIKRKEKVILEEIRKKPGDKPGVLIVDAIREGGEIRPQVENWLWQQPEFEEKREYTMMELVRFQGNLTYEDMAEINRSIRKAVGSLQSSGVTNYHVFIRGPLVLASVVGCILANHRPSILYQQTKNGGYESWGALNQ